MRDVSNKEIRENDAIATIKFKEDISKDIINEIDNIISKNYDKNSRFIIKIDTNTYKGDMACLSGYAWKVVEEINKKKLGKYITKYLLYNPDTDEEEDFLEEIEGAEIKYIIHINREELYSFLREIYSRYDENLFSGLNIIYMCIDGKFSTFSISSKESNSFLKVYDIDKIIDYLLINNINEFVLCNNKLYPFFSVEEYKVIKKIYIFSKIFGVDLINYYGIGKDFGIQCFYYDDGNVATKIPVINKEGKYECLDIIFNNKDIYKFIESAKEVFKEEINGVMLIKNKSIRIKNIKDIIKKCYALDKDKNFKVFEIFDDNYIKINDLIEYDMKNLKDFDN